LPEPKQELAVLQRRGGGIDIPAIPTQTIAVGWGPCRT
jgi:hypothetical protein